MKAIAAPTILTVVAITGLAYPGICATGPEPGTASTQTLSSHECAALASAADFSMIQDAPTQITSAQPIDAARQRPAYCEILGYVSPQVGFQIGLPAHWNGKLLELGCGGDCGDLSYFASGCGPPLEQGYACVAFNGGHTGSGGLWALNNLHAQVDFGYRGAHVTALAAKAITERYYHRAPKHSYFWGASTGGRQALVEAQRFPWDFDGIISGAPWINDTDSAMAMVWAHRALTDQDGKPLLTRAELQLVHDAALARCDLDDGVKDGLIGNPATCRFDPRDLLCRPGTTSDCLTEAQADAVRRVYAGPRNSKGEKTYVGGPEPGSEMGWVDDGVLDYIRSDGQLGGSEGWALIYFRYMVIPPAGPLWKLSDFNFDTDYKRFGTGVQESLLNAANPDLRKFKAAGGKLIIYQGWNDQSDLPAMTVDYYETVIKAMGGLAATTDFARLFMVPGMLHVTGGDGPFAIDYLAYLDAWVDKHKSPVQMLGAHVDDAYLTAKGRRLLSSAARRAPGSAWTARFLGAATLEVPLDPAVPVTFTRPIYPYPLRAKYKGQGNPNDAANFGPVKP